MQVKDFIEKRNNLKPNEHLTYDFSNVGMTPAILHKLLLAMGYVYVSSSHSNSPQAEFVLEMRRKRKYYPNILIGNPVFIIGSGWDFKVYLSSKGRKFI